jgi:YggT family protein
MFYLANVINVLFTVLEFAILIRVILSWTRVDPFHPLVRLLDQITEPILAPFRRIFPPQAGLDFSPILAFFALEILRRLVLRLLF